MGDWDTAENALADMIPQYHWAWSHQVTALMFFDWAWDDYQSGHYNEALGDVIQGGLQLTYSMRSLIRKDNAYDPPYLAPYFATNYGNVTWQNIVDAWMLNDFEGRSWTIGVIDKMRQKVWDEPFDEVWAARLEGREY